MLDDVRVAVMGEEMARLHDASQRAMSRIPPTSKSIKSDAINLLELLSDRDCLGMFHLPAAELAFLRGQCLELLDRFDELGYDDAPKLPVLIDWNLGNFSVAPTDRGFRLVGRWDYDWLRIDLAVLDFYFLSRLSSATGDRTLFHYGPHTLLDPRFASFLRAYRRVRPLARRDLELAREAYRFFVLHYVVRYGEHFFQPDVAGRLRGEAADCLRRLAGLDFEPLYALAG